MGGGGPLPLLLDAAHLGEGLRRYNAEHIPTFFTLSPTLQNYRDAFTSVPLGRYLLNTVFFAVVTTALMVVVITLSAYAFARMEFRGKNLLFTLFLSLMMIPTELVVITNYAPSPAWSCATPLPASSSPRSPQCFISTC